MRQGARGHFARGFFADRAEFFQRRGRHAQHVLFGGIGIGDEAAIEIIGTPGNGGHLLTDPASSAGFRRRHHPAALLEFGADFGRQRRKRVVFHIA